MLFELSPALRRASQLVLILAAAVSLSACQVRPLYSSTSGTPQKLAAIKFSAAGDRVGQVVRNQLIFLTSGGAGEAVTADYQLAMSVTSVRADILDDQISQSVTPGRVTVSATYTLTKISDGKVLRTATRSVTSLVDIGNQQFAKLRAYRDAEDRAGRELAEFIRADLAATLGR
ncbi:LPS-assembly lipoprotein [Neorhizobium galegae]|uniref:LPS assembly lipoprotein LptE n=1 Tax=Rhizobium/Agrobacterium group TaxID=227290 RepID=UPI001AE6C74B|nr:LPS assembly lipoprotein LptE [Neorhizobium galegae]MBP2551319.1 LPS-assembly lipoprotein [Neorhizobium galegae]